MKREELIKELRRAERYCLNEYSTMAKQAADLIESQQKEIERLKAKLGQMKTQCMTIRNELCMKCGNCTLAHEGPATDAGGGGEQMERGIIGVMRAAFEQSADRIATVEESALVLKNEIDRLRAQVPRWIPVEERLPEKWLDDAGMVNYMICSPDFGVDIGSYHAEAKKWFCMALPCTVTHWMPLPKAPEVE